MITTIMKSKKPRKINALTTFHVGFAHLFYARPFLRAALVIEADLFMDRKFA